uniref:Uncharacterized protein n=1 Tax=Meloidogyne incognita TaxID=6306 RepID=A0A914LKC5_MELIC
MKFFKFTGPACCLHGWFGLIMFFFKDDGAMVEQLCLVGGCVAGTTSALCRIGGSQQSSSICSSTFVYMGTTDVCNMAGSIWSSNMENMDNDLLGARQQWWLQLVANMVFNNMLGRYDFGPVQNWWQSTIFINLLFDLRLHGCVQQDVCNMAGSIWSSNMENMDNDLVGKTVLVNNGGCNWWQTWSSTTCLVRFIHFFKLKNFAKNAHASPAFLHLFFCCPCPLSDFSFHHFLT